MREEAKKKTIKPVKCVETNVCYESAREASRQTGVSYSGIGKACKDSHRTSGGFHWCFIIKEEK